MYAGQKPNTLMMGISTSNDDLISAFGSSSVSATQRYVSKGYTEGRSLDTLMHGDIWQVMMI